MTARYDETHWFEPVRQILDRVLGSGPLKKKRETAEVWAVWAEAVGPSIAAHTKPLRLERGTLTVEVDSAAWHHQLHALQGKILHELDVRLVQDRVTKLRFLVASQR